MTYILPAINYNDNDRVSVFHTFYYPSWQVQVSEGYSLKFITERTDKSVWVWEKSKFQKSKVIYNEYIGENFGTLNCDWGILGVWAIRVQASEVQLYSF